VPGGITARGILAGIDSDAPDGGEVVQKFVSICEASGLKRKNVPSSRHYGHTADRWYGDEGLRSAEFLVLNRQPQAQSVTKPDHDEEGRLVLLGKNVKSILKVGSVYPNHVVLANEVKVIFENAGFAGIKFGEVAVNGEPTGKTTGQIWELQSSIVLPKMANVHQFIHPGRTEPEPFQGDYFKLIMLNDPPFNKGEVHYRRSELTALGAFDIARTFENYMEPHPALVISQRLYQHCLKNKIKLDADPVRIDPD
jgi:hypothetical protein